MAGVIPVTQMYGQAQAAWDAQQEEFRRAAAYNALNRMYGPIAGNPDAALKMQSYDYNRQMQPLQIQNQQLTNEAVGQRNNYLKQSYPLLLENQGLSNTGQGITNNFNSEKLDQAKLTTAGQKALQLHGVLGGALDSLTSSLDGVTDPNQRGAIFDQTVARIAPLVGMDADTAAQQLAADRQAVMQNGGAAITRLRGDLDSTIYSSLSPKDRATILKTQAQTELSNAKLQTEQQKQLTAKYGKPGDLQKSIAAGQFLNDRVGNVIGTVNTTQSGTTQYGTDGLIGQAYQLMAKLPKDGASLKTMALVPGSDAYKLQGILDQISHNLSVDDLRNMKQSGLSLGRVTVAEFQAVSKAIANTDLGQGTDLLRTQLGRVGKLYGDLYQSNNNDIQTMQQQLHEIQGGAPAGGQQQAPSNGLMQPGGMMQQPAGSPQSNANPTGQALTQAQLRPNFMRVNEQWGDPRKAGWASDNLARIPSPVGGTVNVNKSAAASFEGFLKDLAATGYKFKSVGGYNLRNIRGSSRLSQHAWGNAIDINPTDNPQGGNKSDMPANVGQLAAKWGLKWGGTFRGSDYDPMHFEWAGHSVVNGNTAVANAQQAPGQQAPQQADNGLMVSAPTPQTEAVGAGQQPQSTAQAQGQQQAPAAQQVASASDDGGIITDGQGGEGEAPITVDQRIFGPVRTLGDATTILKQMGVIQ